MAYIELTADEAARAGCRGCHRVVVVDQPGAPAGCTEAERIARALIGAQAHPSVTALLDRGMFAGALAEHTNRVDRSRARRPRRAA